MPINSPYFQFPVHGHCAESPISLCRAKKWGKAKKYVIKIYMIVNFTKSIMVKTFMYIIYGYE